MNRYVIPYSFVISLLIAGVPLIFTVLLLIWGLLPSFEQLFRFFGEHDPRGGSGRQRRWTRNKSWGWVSNCGLSGRTGGQSWIGRWPRLHLERWRRWGLLRLPANDTTLIATVDSFFAATYVLICADEKLLRCSGQLLIIEILQKLTWLSRRFIRHLARNHRLCFFVFLFELGITKGRPMKVLLLPGKFIFECTVLFQTVLHFFF